MPGFEPGGAGIQGTAEPAARGDLVCVLNNDTLLADDGARHVILDYDIDNFTSSLMLGSRIDAEPDGFPSVQADGDDLEAFQSEAEGELISRLHAARTDGTDALVINPGALTHYSYALRDALELVDVPKVEVHLSQTHAREEFRRHSVVSPVVDVTITGAGVLGYRLAVRAAIALAEKTP